jgi:hypothetical protein
MAERRLSRTEDAIVLIVMCRWERSPHHGSMAAADCPGCDAAVLARKRAKPLTGLAFALVGFHAANDS